MARSLSTCLASAGALAVLLATSGCATQVATLSGDYITPIRPPPGYIYASVKAPLQVTFDGNKTGAAAKESSWSNTSFLGIPFVSLRFAWDDVAIEDIATEGGIDEIAYADYEIFNILGIYKEFTITVYGN